MRIPFILGLAGTAASDKISDVRRFNTDPPILPFVQPQEEASGVAEEGQGPDAGIWECEYSAGGVYCGVADG
jgi:hypothetical protein